MTALERSPIAALDFALEIPCEGLLHAAGGEGHDGGPAAFGVSYACPGCNTDRGALMLCAGQVNYHRNHIAMNTAMPCDRCRKVSPIREWITSCIPLTPPSSGDATPDDPAPRAPRSPRAPRPTRKPDPVPALSWADALAAFALAQAGKGLSPRTIQNREWTLNALARAVDRGPAEVTVEHVRARLSRGIGKASMQAENDTYRAFFRFLHEDKKRPDDLSEQLPTIKAPRGKPRPYSDDQIGKLIGSGAYSRTRVMIMLAALQGMRAGEIAAIHGSDIDLEQNLIRIVGKAGKQAWLPLHPAIRDVALQMPREGYWFPARGSNDGEHIHSRSVSDLMSRAKKRAGITEEKLTGHSLRHSYGTNLVREGVDLRTVQELMRHELLTTTQIYTEITPEQMRDGIDRLKKPGTE